MQENLLNSVIKITKNRDVDSLEYSLISTIQEFIGCKEVSVYKDIEVQGQLTIEQSLCLKVTGEKQFEWVQRQLLHSLRMNFYRVYVLPVLLLFSLPMELNAVGSPLPAKKKQLPQFLWFQIV